MIKPSERDLDKAMVIHGIMHDVRLTDNESVIEVARYIAAERASLPETVMRLYRDLEIIVRDLNLGYPTNPNAPMHGRLENHLKNLSELNSWQSGK